MLLKRLKKYVTAFSVELPKFAHKSEVKVGGRIVRILDLDNIMVTSDDKKNQLGVYIALDDSLGEIPIVLRKDVYEHFKDQYDLKVGDYILASGKVFVLGTEMEYMKEGKIVKVDPRSKKERNVFCHEIVPLPEESVVEENRID